MIVTLMITLINNLLENDCRQVTSLRSGMLLDMYLSISFIKNSLKIRFEFEDFSM